MWVSLAFISALFLGFYETAKKKALWHNQVLAVLWSTIFISALFFLPVILDSLIGGHWFEGTLLQIPRGHWQEHSLVAIKAFIVLCSWLCGYVALKRLPLTVAMPIDALRPVAVLIGALLVFGERLNGWQWTGIFLLMSALYLLSYAEKRNGLTFFKNKWVWLMGLSTLLAAMSGLYDKFLMQRIDSVFVQSWFNVYQLLMMSLFIGGSYWLGRSNKEPFHWSWMIVAVSVCLSIADFAYFYALRQPDALISVISMIRRGSVLVAFTCGVVFLHEPNWRAKLKVMGIIVCGLLFLWWGS